jgi:hypothetical protein
MFSPWPVVLALFVETCVQMLAGFEEGYSSARDFDRDARSRVSTGARFAMPDRERSEAAYLDPITPSKCVADRREDGFDNALDIAVLEMWVQLSHPSHQVRLCHSSPPSSS